MNNEQNHGIRELERKVTIVGLRRRDPSLVGEHLPSIVQFSSSCGVIASHHVFNSHALKSSADDLRRGRKPIR
jgi:hypothetical protein